MKVDKTKWEKKTLKDIVLTVQNINWRNNVNCYQYIDLTSVNRETKSILETISINANSAPSRAKQIVNIGDVIFATTRPTQMRVAMISEKYHDHICSTGYCVLRPNENKINSSFLFYCLQSNKFKQYLSLKEGGAAYPAVSNGIVLAYTILIPPLSEQQTIATELDSIQTIIDGYKAQLADLDALVQSIFLDMFGDPVTNPKGWEKHILNGICDVRDGTHDSPKYIDNGIPLITSKNIVNGKIDYSDAKNISISDADAINKRSKVNNGDIIMPMIGAIGHPIIVEEVRPFCIKNVALIKFHNPNVLNIYIKHLLSSSSFDEYMHKINKGVAQKFISLKVIRNFSIPLPPLSLQQQFAERAEAIEKQKELILQQLADAEQLMAERMQYYFS